MVMLRLFVEAVNKGEMPSIETTWHSICKQECERFRRGNIFFLICIIFFNFF